MSEKNRPCIYYIDKVLSKQIRIRRGKMGLSQEDLSFISGVSRDAISKLESCRTDPKLSTIGALAGALKCEPADLLSEKPRTDIIYEYIDPDNNFGFGDSIVIELKRSIDLMYRCLKYFSIINNWSN